MIDLKVIKDNVGVVTIDRQNSSANILDANFFDKLNMLIDRIEREPVRALIFTSAKPKIFLAGADLVSMNENLNDECWLEGVIDRGQETFNRIENLGIPTVAAIHGACLGGGLELSLACKYRIASNDDCTKIGLPEVMLGILPAWGGTTRLPRLIGLTKSMGAILSGRAYAPKQAKKLGIVDEVCHKENLINRAILLCDKELKRPKPNRIIQSLVSPIIFHLSRKKIINQTKGNYPAPLKIIKVISKGFFQNKNKSLNLEKKAFIELAQTSACKNLIRIFFLQEKAKKSKRDPNLPKWHPGDYVAVIGSGTMGAGIAQWTLSRGKQVLLKDISASAIASGLKRIGKLFVSAVLKHKIKKPIAQACLGRLSTSIGNPPLSNRGVVIEAVVENFDLKSKILRELESKMSKSAILATNTSALSITELSKDLLRPENFIGIHFFNPVHKMKLVEIVVGEKTSEETVNKATTFVKSVGKLPVVVKDRPGFLVNRILLPYLIEALRLFSQGNPTELIDKIMLDFGMPMGPLRLLDEIGIDVAAHVAMDLEKRLPDFKVPAILKDILKTEKLGKKTGQGFYIYRHGKPIGVNPLFNNLQRKENAKNKTLLQERMVNAMIEESEKCVKEQIADSEDDIDFAMIMGAGWAPFLGGPRTYSR
jgi:3-hydroxyacyl-CoA dehydrogenase/enoyl-CoA hydratase/3-hydroxybutyryl-CoA epimerase